MRTLLNSGENTNTLDEITHPDYTDFRMSIQECPHLGVPLYYRHITSFDAVTQYCIDRTYTECVCEN